MQVEGLTAVVIVMVTAQTHKGVKLKKTAWISTVMSYY